MSAGAGLTESSEPAGHTASRVEQNRSESFDEALTWMYTSSAERLRRVGERLRALPAWLSVLLIYGISRVWGFVVFAVVGQQQLRGPWGEHLSYLSFISTWDAGWYEQIALNGYPSELPVNAMGVVQQNQWAFYPIFPLLSQGISRLTGIAYYPVAATVALLAASRVPDLTPPMLSPPPRWRCGARPWCRSCRWLPCFRCLTPSH